MFGGEGQEDSAYYRYISKFQWGNFKSLIKRSHLKNIVNISLLHFRIM